MYYSEVQCNCSQYSPRERVARMCSAAMRTMCATMRGVRVYQENVSTSPFPFPCPLQCLVAYLGQGNKGHQLQFLLLVANPISFLSAFFWTLTLDIETKSGRKFWLELLVCSSPQYGPFIFQPWLAPPPTHHLAAALVNIGHSC